MTDPRLVMVIGFQRSGTNALFDSLAGDRRFLSFNEVGESEIYSNFYLKAEPEIRSIFHAGKNVLLKPISETKRRNVEDLFQEFAAYDVRVLHIHRDPVNTYYSVSVLWDTTPEEFIEQWNRRNSSIFSVSEKHKQKVAFVKYEDMILDPEVFYSASRFAGIRGKYRFHPDSHSGRKNLPKDVVDRLDKGTEDLWKKLEASRTFLPRDGVFSMTKLVQEAKYNLKRYL
jgi:hypothetical protein